MKYKSGSAIGEWRRRFLGGIALCAAAFGALSSAMAADGPAVSVQHPVYITGEDIVINFSGGPGKTKDWIGIYPQDVVPGSVNSTRWYYVDNTQGGSKALTEGTVLFAGGMGSAGTWDAHLLFNDGYDVLASTRFEVVDVGTPLVRASQRVYTVGQAISISFFSGPGNTKDWIGIYKEGQAPGGPASTLWSYVDGTSSGNAVVTDGSVSFSSGLSAAGTYVVYLLANDGYDVVSSETFAVVLPSASQPRVLSVVPGDGATGVPPAFTYTANITNGTAKVAAASVKLLLNGQAVDPSVTELNGLVTVSLTTTGLFPALSTNSFHLTFSDTASPAASYTNDMQFVVGDYRNIELPAPLFFENFDATPEGELPAGWTGVTYTEVGNSEPDLGNLDSASYAGWVNVAASRFSGPFVTYSDPTSPVGWQMDYAGRVLTINPLNVLNGAVYSQPLGKGRFLIADSGYRNGVSQVDYLYTPDYDLSAASNVHLSFHSIWEQNQDSSAYVEYSVDKGANWLPVVYMLDRADVVTMTEPGTGNTVVDAEATFNTEGGDIAHYTDPNSGEDKGGTYGAFVFAPISQALAPYISARANDNSIESKRIELYRLPAADKQKTVRVRFAMTGSDSWYWGIDDFGIYSIGPSVAPTLSVSNAGGQLTIAWTGSASGYTLETSPSIGVGAQWSTVAAITGQANVTVPASQAIAFFRLRK